MPIGSDYVICLKGHKTRGGPTASAAAVAVTTIITDRTLSRISKAAIEAMAHHIRHN